ERLLVEIAVVADLMAAPQHLAGHVRVALDDPARNEEAALDVVLVEDAENTRNARLGSVGAHAHVERPLGERRIAQDPRALTVDVERDHHRAPRPVLPLDRPFHACLLYAPATFSHSSV